jgi:hypothetical protein
MGLIETLFEHLSLKAAAIILGTSFTLWVILTRLDEHRRITRLGNYGPSFKVYWPLGEYRLITLLALAH